MWPLIKWNHFSSPGLSGLLCTQTSSSAADKYSRKLCSRGYSKGGNTKIHLFPPLQEDVWQVPGARFAWDNSSPP